MPFPGLRGLGMECSPEHGSGRAKVGMPMREMQGGEAKQAVHTCILLIVIMPCPWGGGFVCFYFLTLPSVPSLPMFKYSELLNNFHMHLNALRSECTCSSEPSSTGFKMKVMKMLINLSPSRDL